MAMGSDGRCTETDIAAFYYDCRCTGTDTMIGFCDCVQEMIE